MTEPKNPDWYPGGCILCGSKDNPFTNGPQLWGMVDCRWLIRFSTAQHDPPYMQYITARNYDGSYVTGLPLCDTCNGNGETRYGIIKLAKEKIKSLMDNFGFQQPSPSSYTNCTRCDFEYPYGGPSLCQRCKLWQTVTS